ncbi:hypothetical protein Ahy_B08g089527 isoform E [Arachis hypogaea]|uniref:ABC1 atypical kinase-like domain-containing protein n=1 Tax=Arachis hypogaea TaxID=3818 RepID=A0A444XY28_ARAHY|nr:hypothetical protein Ahy_B08g089527 isoform E [Arachis hypogaea]
MQFNVFLVLSFSNNLCSINALIVSCYLLFMSRQLCGSIPDVVIPLMYKDYTTHKVLVMEWVEGKKLSEVKDLYLIEVIQYRGSFNQLLECGFYHADPHPGNLLRTYDGKLAYLDFGMTGEFKQELRDGFIQACLHLVNRDFDALSKDFVTLGCLPKCCCPRSSQYQLWRPFRKLRNHHVSCINSNLEYLHTSLLSFEALGSLPLFQDGVFRVDRLESLLTESLRAKTEKSLVKQQPEGTDSRMAMKEILSFTLTEKGEYVREIIVQEFAKWKLVVLSMSNDMQGIIQVSQYQNQTLHMENLSLVPTQLESVQEILPVLSIVWIFLNTAL